MYLLLVLNVLIPACYAQVDSQLVDEEKKLADLGLHERCAPEPVFNDIACIYEINIDAKQTVVLIHGLGASSASWYQQVKALMNNYHVISFDLPGFGRSSRGNKLYTPTQYAKFIQYVYRQYINKPFYIIGHSMGAAISLRYSNMYPDNVKRLVLADVGGVLHQYSYARSVAMKWYQFVKKTLNWIAPEYKSMPLFNELASSIFQNLEWLPIDIKDALNIPELRSIILQGNSTTIAGAAVSSENFSGAIRNNNIPTLIIWGAYDLVTPLRTGKILQARMRNARLVVLSKSAHSPMSDQPQLFNRLMLRHLTKTGQKNNKSLWQFRKFVPSKRVGRCHNLKHKVFEGDYQRLEINNCDKVLIKNVNSNSLLVKNSDVIIETSQFESKDVAIIAMNSTIEMTASNIKAPVGLQISASHLDFAGVDFRIEKAIINNQGNSDAVFSVSQVNGIALHQYSDLSLKGKI